MSESNVNTPSSERFVRLRVRAPVIATFRSPAGRATVFLILSVVRATIISLFVLVAIVMPLQHLRWLAQPVLLLAQILNIPIYCAGKVLGPLRSAFPFLFPQLLRNTHIDNGFVIRNVQTGVLAYAALFHVPSAIRLARDGSVARRTKALALVTWLALLFVLSWACGIVAALAVGWLRPQ